MNKTIKEITADDVRWVVNNLAELGVEIGGRCFFLYKGESIEYTDRELESDPDGIMKYREVAKREFGETCHPPCYYDEGYNTRDTAYDRKVYDPFADLDFRTRKEKFFDYEWKPLPIPDESAGVNVEGSFVRKIYWSWKKRREKKRSRLSRMVSEKHELYDKLRRLRFFIGSGALELLEPEEQKRLRAQEKSMSEYCEILMERIKNYKPLSGGEIR